MFTITRIYSDIDGESHFEDFAVLMGNKGDIGFLSEKTLVKGIIFREVAPSYDYDFHNATQQHFIILLDGNVEIETYLSQNRNFAAGKILFVEDTTGKGHKTKNLENRVRKSFFL